MAESHEISFWAHQFVEHCKLMITLMERNNVLDDEDQQLNNLQAKWHQIHDQPRVFNLTVIDDTRNIKEYVKNKFSEAEIDCLPDLIDHMIEELNYFEGAIINGQYTPLEEMQWWAREHSENLDFANCELPILIQEDSIIAKVTGRSQSYDIVGPPQKAEKMKKENEHLSQQFKALANKIGQQLLNKSSSEALYNQLFALKIKHLNGLTDAINNIENLPLSPDTQKMVYEMLHHESAEADFAFDRLKKINF